MSGYSAKIEWYLARDGQQHGPLSAIELDKFIELGHLKPTDLLWRVGFDDWRTATDVFPPLPPKPQPQPPVQTAAPSLSVDAPGVAGAARPVRQHSQSMRPSAADVVASTHPDETTRPVHKANVARSEAQAGAMAAGRAAPAGADFSQAGRPSDTRAPADMEQRALHAEPGPQRAPVGPTDPSQLIEPVKRAGAVAAPDATTIRPGRPVQDLGAPSVDVPMAAAAVPRAEDLADEEYLEDEEGGRGGWLMVAAALFLFVLLGAGGLFAYNNQTQIAAMYSDLLGKAMPADVAVVRAPKQATRERLSKSVPTPVATTPLRPIEPKPQLTPPVANKSVPEVPILKSKLWQFAQKEFGEWTEQRLAERAEQDNSKEDANKYLVASFVKFRRNNAEYALLASPDSLEDVAAAFVDSLRALTTKGAKACYAYISNGETTPEIAQYYFEPSIAPKLEAQMLAIMKAIADGKSSPTKTRTEPTSGDFNKLSAELGKRGWSAADLKLFSDPIALSKAKPQVVCRLVTEWFATQTTLGDRAIRDQLIAASLRPVIGG